jgi:hypothetical protein
MVAARELTTLRVQSQRECEGVLAHGRLEAERMGSSGELIDLVRGNPGDETHDMCWLGRRRLAEVFLR